MQEKKSLSPEPITPAPLLKNNTRPIEQTHSTIIEERFLEDLRERILVLFEGLQSPNNTNVEAKVDLTLNFLEHLLAQIDTQLDKI
ncbi:MAG: hypothetical protein OEW60_07075 [Thiovulaceae bacterium]|nr:hypothetical protein [Sulfurimonadaceae bacterium]